MTFVKLSCLFALCLVQVATIIPSTSSALTDSQREGYFNGSSYIKLGTTISFYNHIGLSFKSCIGGELFSQHYTNGNVVSLQVQPDGLVLLAKVMGHNYEVRLPARLLDNMWHAVNLFYKLGNLALSAGGHQQVVANKTFNAEILHPDLSNSKNALLKVGDGFVGCILEGPSLVLGANTVQSSNVLWGECLLKTTGCPKPDPHCTLQCMNYGVCVLKAELMECHCTPRYTGGLCELDTGSPCDRKPCMNGGRCEEDATGNFTCRCSPTHGGSVCEAELATMPCETNLCPNGTCFYSPSTPDRHECMCPPGYRGQNCEVNINDCQSSPCKNGGSCTDGINSFLCNCERTGYSGPQCEHNIDECVPISPCLNQGVCFDIYGGYVCQCLNGFGGQNCELNLNECSSNPCLNGGKCEDKVGSYNCHCRTGFSGANCEVNINECEVTPLPCVPDYDCVDGVASYNCVCKPGYQGTPPNCTLMAPLVPCISNVCQNGGTCQSSGELILCSCPLGFTGMACQTNECSSNPCLEGGTCVGKVGGYTCICPEGTTGVNCEQPVNACTPVSPCKNNAVCAPGASKGDFYCQCQTGWAGPTCEATAPEPEENPCPDGPRRNGTDDSAPCGSKSKSLDACANLPCNNGTCQLTDEGYTCMCPEGITGTNCETDINECNENSSICNNGVCFNIVGGYQCYCRPGFAGNQCDIDIDECLSHPCQNNASCKNHINSYSCVCMAGYSGINCNTNIDECESDPCQNGATCVDKVAGFMCLCPPGLTGLLCETNIDDCASMPCQHNGKCIDGINSFECDCNNTGYYGNLCELNVDDCESNPCANDGTCVDLVLGYRCKCHPGYSGKNCQTDVNECESNPCQFGGKCLEHSDVTLYNSSAADLPAFFKSLFTFSRASGYECVCVPGTVGMNCEKDINECESNPCHPEYGKCKDEIGRYRCECEDGFEGELCEMEINECDRYTPCVNGSCFDRRNDYYCDCFDGFGGKNCSVELIGCARNYCMNHGQCLPYLENETDHKFNCSCPNGFHGKLCEKSTTMSLSGSSYVLVNTTREEGYDIQFRFKTTLPGGLLAFGKGLTFYILSLVNGRLNLRSSLVNKLEGVSVGSGLNDSKWHKVFVAINTSHLVLAANEEQTIYPISFNEANTSHTSFPTTYLGGTIAYFRRLTNSPSFVGCTEDVQVNGEWVIPQDTQETSKHPVILVGVEMGCPREAQCSPNPCHSGGHCTDLWSDFSCTCERPYLGHTCQYNLTAATFGHENITTSMVTVRPSESTRRAVRNVVDISMFIRTRQDKGFIFYLGSEPGSVPFNEETYIMAQLEGGELKGRIQLKGVPDAYGAGRVKLDNGYSHLIQVVRNGTLIQFLINNTEYFRNTIGASEHLSADVLYLGGMPQVVELQDESAERVSRFARQMSQEVELEVPEESAEWMSRVARQSEGPALSSAEPTARLKADQVLTLSKPDSMVVHFKGIIQDVQISNGTRNWVVEFFPLKVEDLDVPASFGNVTLDRSTVLEGEMSDDTCRNNPCLHNGSCFVTWNDFRCQCPRGYKGKYCQEMEFCQLQDCPTGSRCRNLDDGYECVANVTLRGDKTELLTYELTGLSKPAFLDVAYDSVNISYRSRTGGTLLYVASQRNTFLSVSVYQDNITVSWKLDDTPGDTRMFSKEMADGNWTSVVLQMKNGKMVGGFPESMDPDGMFPLVVNNFPVDAWRGLVSTGKVTLGGTDTQIRFADHVSISSNSVDMHDMDHAHLGYFKGCLGEVRIGGMLLPFFTPDLLYNENFTAKNYYALKAVPPRLVDEMGCILCFEEECKNGGSCLDANTTYSCDCPVGYTEEDCSKDIDWCESELPVCLNGGTCVDGVANFTCLCPVGFTGATCETNIDECASNPCVNGECEDLVGEFRCVCPETFEGERCENVRIITCADRPCQNGAACSSAVNKVTGDNFTCTCADGFVDRVCATPFCVERTCQNGGTCNTSATPRCACVAGYEGTLCEIDTDECMSGPCQNGGTCTDDLDTFTCNCSRTGYEGDTCELDEDECSRGETLCGDGACINTPGSYKCICTARGEEHMCGFNCNISDPCAGETPCLNGGTCREKCTDLPLYDCICPEGYQGPNCTESGVGSAASLGEIAIIVGPIVAFLLLAAGVGLSVFIMMARKKRATRGTYSPSQQEYCNPRVEMDNTLKPPPEERLI